MSNALDPRAAELLKLLVERYIHDGQPVGDQLEGIVAATAKKQVARLAIVFRQLA